MIYENNNIIYNGNLLKSKFGYDFYKEKYKSTGVVVIFNGSLNIDYDELIFNHNYEQYEESINICWEIPNLNSIGNSFFKTLFLLKIAEQIKKTDIFSNVDVKNNNIISVYDKNNKYDDISVSLIRQAENNISLGYIGINSYIFNLSEKQNHDFCSSVNKIFYELTENCFIDTIKTL